MATQKFTPNPPTGTLEQRMAHELSALHMFLDSHRATLMCLLAALQADDDKASDVAQVLDLEIGREEDGLSDHVARLRDLVAEIEAVPKETPRPIAQVVAPRCELRAELEAERTRIFQAMGIVSCITGTVNRNVDVGKPDIASAADAAEALLNTCAGRLEEIGKEFGEDEQDDVGARS